MRIKLPRVLRKIISSILFKSRSRRSEIGARVDDTHGGVNGSGIDDCQFGDNDNIHLDDPSHHQKVVTGIGKPTLSMSQSFREMLHGVGKFDGRKDSVGNQVMDTLRISAAFNKLRKTHGKDLGSKQRKAAKEEANTMELCKKRIMMGRRCRSLNLSGALHYDQNGILLPEEIIPAPDV